MFEQTLYTPRAIRVHLSFRRPSKEPNSVSQFEDCFLVSLGDGLDGQAGRAHGGFNSLLLDHISGHAAYHADPDPLSPATATMTTDYKAPIKTPCVVLARAWVVEHIGRKCWVSAVMEDGEGKAYAASKALFIAARKTPKL